MRGMSMTLAKADSVSRPVVLFGLSGVLVEVLNDVILPIAPFDEREARHIDKLTAASRRAVI